jgi:hypothetical protein
MESWDLASNIMQSTWALLAQLAASGQRVWPLVFLNHLASVISEAQRRDAEPHRDRIYVRTAPMVALAQKPESASSPSASTKDNATFRFGLGGACF